MTQKPRCEEPCIPIKVLVGVERAKQIVVDLGAPRAEIESGLRKAFSTVPGFTSVRWECVEVDETWWDLISGVGGPDPQWHPIPLELASAEHR